jgi:hypothetical protein
MARAPGTRSNLRCHTTAVTPIHVPDIMLARAVLV